ncbi:unnamed protein product [Ceutorhynchus assimilis]|uniref:PROP1-like PPR domain-containing protein n=1 Tax=Ceutorhynchus assimilis TaxID=467358 RepID=A0A9N9QR30_9CUCU|nr:unnamed protein product [Ceutorhynchus assimilis]
MFKIKFCGNLAQKYLVSPLLSTRIIQTTNSQKPKTFSSLPDSENDYNKPKQHFKSMPPNPVKSWKPIESEQEYLVKIKNDPDTFGNDTDTLIEYPDKGDILEEKFFTEQPKPGQRLSTKKYADLIKTYIRQRKIKEAIDVLEVRMLKEDRVKPENYIYNLLLGACGRVGYTKKAFMLYNNMKKRGLQVHPGTYTALFNACANSPWPLTDGLTRAKHLYDIMIEKSHQPNDTNYNAMIKAFGRCGDLPMAFSLVDEMAQKGFPIKNDTINFLLQACVSDKDTGFRHSLLVWRKLIEKNIKPDIFTFNLLLRCVRDCGLGNIEATKEVIEKIVCPESNRLYLSQGEELENVQKDLSVDLRPNLLAKQAHLGNILSLSEISKPEDKLLLVGGCKGFLETMSQHKCIPDIKTFTQLLNSLPSTQAAEKELIAAMKKANVVADIDFYNMLIKKKSLRSDYKGAREVLALMENNGMRPDLITYGVLAIGCKTKEEALDLVDQMKSSAYTLNAVILGAMLQQACYHQAFDYINEIMQLCLRDNVPVNKKFLEHLDNFKKKMKNKLASRKASKYEVGQFSIFKERYKTWLTEVQADETEEAHPWQQYRQERPGDVKHFSPKDSERFKPRHSSRFKVKTSIKHREKGHSY